MLAFVGQNFFDFEFFLLGPFVEFGYDVTNDEFNAGHDYVLQGVDSSAGDFEALVDGQVGGLQGGDFDYFFEEVEEGLFSHVEGLAAAGQAENLRVVSI